MKYKLEHKPVTPRSGEKWLVIDSTNPYSEDNPLHSSFIGRVVAECESKDDAQLLIFALNKAKI